MAEKGTRSVRPSDQWLLDALLATPVTGFANPVQYRILRGMRKLRLLFSDPLVSFSLGPCRLQLPLSMSFRSTGDPTLPTRLIWGAPAAMSAESIQPWQ